MNWAGANTYEAVCMVGDMAVIAGLGLAAYLLFRGAKLAYRVISAYQDARRFERNAPCNRWRR
jgi:hypothetical protein